MTTTKTETTGEQVVPGFRISPEAAVCDAMDTEPVPVPIEREHLHCTRHWSAQLDVWYDCHDLECIMTDRPDLTEEFRRRLTIHSHPQPQPDLPYQRHYHTWWSG